MATNKTANSYSYNRLYFIFAKKIELGRIIALDYGTKRTGIAVTDELQIIASGLTTVNTHELLKFLKEYLAEENVEAIVVGAPKRMDNSPSEVEKYISDFLPELKKLFPQLRIERQDERFTSKLAFQSMIEGGMGKQKRRNKALVDEISATLILQAYLSRKV